MLNSLPDISSNEIKNHLDWYKMYLNLKKKKKDAITNWRKSKKVNLNKIASDTTINAPKIIEVSPKNIQEKLEKWKVS